MGGEGMRVVEFSLGFWDLRGFLGEFFRGSFSYI